MITLAKVALVTLAGLDWVLDKLLQADGITHMAIGDSAAPITGAELALGNELHRQVVTDVVKVDRSLFVDTRVPSTEANFQWQEVGLFLNGTDLAGTGTLLCRLLLSYDHTTSEASTVSIEVKATSQ